MKEKGVPDFSFDDAGSDAENLSVLFDIDAATPQEIMDEFVVVMDDINDYAEILNQLVEFKDKLAAKIRESFEQTGTSSVKRADGRTIFIKKKTQYAECLLKDEEGKSDTEALVVYLKAHGYDSDEFAFVKEQYQSAKVSSFLRECAKEKVPIPTDLVQVVKLADPQFEIQIRGKK
jgi:hypothetical protein